MKKSDARVRYTQRVLKESFLSLLRKKPINKITVKEVCELAELNRATFYSHYSDCFDLMEKIFFTDTPSVKIGEGGNREILGVKRENLNKTLCSTV